MQNLYKLQVVFRDDDSSSQKISVNFAASILCYAFLDFELASLHREVIKIIVTAISSPNSSAQKEYAQALMTAVIIASLMSDRQCDWLYKDNLEWGIVALIFHMKTLDCVLKKAKAQESDIKYLKQTIDACPVYKEKEVPDLFKICIQQLMLVINDESNSVKTQKIDIIHSIINILTDSYVTSFEKYASLLTILSQVTDLPVCLQHFFTATFYTKQKVLLDAIIQHPLPYLSALIEDENKSLVLNEIESIKQQYAAHSDDFYSIVQFSDITFDALFEKKKIFYAYLSEYILCHQAHDTYALLNNNDTSFDEVYGNVVYDIVALNHISSAPYMLRASKYHLFAKIYLMECSATSVQSEFLLSMVNTIGQHVDRVSFLGELCMLDFNIGLNVLKIQSDFDTIVYDVFVRMANQFAHKGIIPSAIEQVVNELNINLNVFYAGLIDRALHSQDLLFFEFFTKTNFDVKGFNNKALSKKVMLRLKNLPQNDRLEEYLFLLEVLVLCKPEGFETIKQKSRLMSFIKYDIKKLTVYAYMQGLVDVIPILIKRAMNNLKNISSNFNNFIISSIISEYHQCRLEKEKQLFIEKGIHSPAAYIQLVDKTFENDLVPISHFVSQHKQKTEMLFSRYKFPEVLDFEVFPDSQLIENIQDHTTQPDAMVFSKENLETHLNKVGIRRLVIN
ncbi:MAG: hypothetical protein FJ161_04170 [Gammaproteobacteria bacterium]|nr:hypothetical protein [Gammaproteobacteria bacterium]